MLDFSIPAHGWDVFYTAILTGGSVVLAYFLGRASERGRERWQRFDVWAARVSDVSKELFASAARKDAPSEQTMQNCTRVWADGPSQLNPKDRPLWSWAMNIIEDSTDELFRLCVLHPTDEAEVKSLNRQWMQAQSTPQAARLGLIGYRESAKKRKALLATIDREQVVATRVAR